MRYDESESKLEQTAMRRELLIEIGVKSLERKRAHPTLWDGPMNQ